MFTLFTILVSLLVFVTVIAVVLYNSLVKKSIRVDEAASDIDVQLKRRYDLIPNLVETVKAYAKHEKETLTEVLEARAKASAMNIDLANANAEQMLAFAGTQSGLSGALGKLMAVAESYPDLKANENFLELQRELTDTEDKIQAARRFFNATVRELNTLVKSFPANLFAQLFGFRVREFFEIENKKEREPVQVKF